MAASLRASSTARAKYVSSHPHEVLARRALHIIAKRGQRSRTMRPDKCPTAKEWRIHTLGRGCQLRVYPKGETAVRGRKYPGVMTLGQVGTQATKVPGEGG